MTLVKCCRNLFQPAVHLENAVVLVISFTRTRRCQQVYSRMKRRQSRRAMKGMTVQRATIAAFGRTTQISIHIHPPSLPPTPLGHNSLFPAHHAVSDKKILERRFARFTSGLIMPKRMTRNSNLCCKKNVNVRQTLTRKQSVPTFSQFFTHKLSHKLRLAY